MQRKIQTLEVIEKTGTNPPDLDTAQLSVLVATAADIAQTIRTLLDSGVLILQNGKIIPNPQRINEHA